MQAIISFLDIYTAVGMVVFFIYYGTHTRTKVETDQKTFGMACIQLIIYMFIYPYDLVKDAWKYFKLKIPYQDL